MSNIALRLAGPAVLTYKGATFASKGDISLDLGNDTFDITVDRYAVVDKRSSGKSASCKFTPIGDWVNLAVLWPYGARIPGDFTTPVRSFDATAGGVAIATETITSTAHGFTTGAAVRIYPTSGSTLPAGLVAGTLYFLNVPTANSFIPYTNRANAVTGGATGRIDITAVGTGTCRIIEQEPLTIQCADGLLYTFNVAAVAQMPNIKGAATETLIGEVTFDLFRTANIPATTASSLYTLGTGTWTDPAITPANILTQGYLFSWGAAPWSALKTVDGLDWTFPLSTEDVRDDFNGVLAKRITDVQCTVKCKPLGVQPVDVMNALLLQGAGAGRGASLATANDFIMTGTGVSVSATNAALKMGGQSMGRSSDRIGELEWFATRKFTAGVPQPMFAVA